MTMANKRTRKPNTKRPATQKQANRMLALEQQVKNMLARRRVDNRMHPVAQAALVGLTAPSLPGLKLHWPDHNARPSLKYSVRARGNIDVSNGGAQVFFPTPSLSRDQVSFCVLNLGTGDLATTSANLRTGATSYYRGTVTNLPFDDAAIADGIVGRCLAVSVKIKYVGSHLNRCGQLMFIEHIDKNLLSTNGITDDASISGWGSELVNDQYTRYVNLATEGEAEFVFHPFMWKNEQSSSQDGWVGYNRLGFAHMPAYNASTTGSGTSQSMLFGNTGSSLAVPHGCLQIYNPSSSTLTYQYEVTMHYEFAGRLAHSLSTPSPIAPPEHVAKVRNAIIHAKMEHSRSPHDTLHDVAKSCLREIEASSVDAGKEALRMVGAAAKGSVTKRLAEGLAALAL